MAVFYKSVDTLSSPMKTVLGAMEGGTMNIKSELADLKAAIKGETDIAKRRELQRKLNRMERFDRVQDGTDIKDENTKGDVAKILKGKNTETYSGSDLLTLRKKGIDIASLTLVNSQNPDTEVKSSELKSGDSFIVNFGNNASLRERTGAGDILPPTVRTIRVNGVECERKNTPRPGYYDPKGKYQKIYDGYSIEIVTIGTGTEEDNKANEKQWKNIRLEDMIKNNDEPLTDIPEDIGLKGSIKDYREKAQNLSKRFHRGLDKAEIMQFRLGDADFISLANNIGLPIEKIAIVKSMMGAIGQHESNSNYGAVGQTLPSGSHAGTAAIGRYQIMPKNWISWGNLHLGEEIEITPINQDKIAFAQMSKYYMTHSRHHRSDDAIFREIAGDWYGRGSAQIAGHPNTGGYQGSVLAIYRGLSQTTTA